MDNKVFRLAPGGSIILPEPTSELSKRKSRLPAIASKFQDTDFSLLEVNRLLCEEVSLLVSGIRQYQRDRNSGFRIKSYSAQIRALQMLRQSANAPPIPGTFDVDGPELKFVFAEMVKILKQAAQKVLEPKALIESIMRHFRDNMVSAEADIRSDLQKLPVSESGAAGTAWRWSSIQKPTVSEQAHAAQSPDILQMLEDPNCSPSEVSSCVLREMALLIQEMADHESDPSSAYQLNSCSAGIMALRNLQRTLTCDRTDFDGPRFHFFVKRVLEVLQKSAQDALGKGNEEQVAKMMESCRDGLDAAGPKIRRELTDLRERARK